MCFYRSFIVLCLMFKLLSHFEFICASGVRGEGNGNPLQYSCLENPRDSGAWLAAIYGVAQSRTLLKRLSSSSSWERLKVGGEGDDRGWDCWMASLNWWTGVWVSSGSWWWRGEPGMLQSMESQRAGHDWGTELNWILFALRYSPDSHAPLICRQLCSQCLTCVLAFWTL